MGLKPIGWTVVVAGRWNPAILTPAGITKRLFKLEQNVGIQVQVPLDGFSPYRVGHPDEDVFVLADGNRILLDVADGKYEALEKGMGFAVNALEGLPETPVLAAGWNVNFLAHEPTAKLLQATASEIDNDFSDGNWEIVARRLGRTFTCGEGVLNVMATRTADGCQLDLNFHKDSKSRDELATWLKTPIQNVRDKVDELVGMLDEEIMEDEDDAVDEPEN